MALPVIQLTQRGPVAPTFLLWLNDGGETEFAEFDAVTSQSHDSQVQIAEHPVETGSNIADHARTEPERVTLEAYVTNNPLSTDPGVEANQENLELDLPPKPFSGISTSALVGAIGDALFSGAKTASGSVNDGQDRARAVYELLKDARDKHRRIRCVTTLAEYDDMLIERLGVPRTIEDGEGISFQIDLKKIRIVTSKIVDAPEPAELRGQGTESKGSKAGKDEKEAKKERKKSLLRSLYD